MKITPIALVGLSVFLLAGCTGKLSTTRQNEESQRVETSETIDPQSIGTSAEVQADTTIQAPAMSMDDDTDSIKADIDATVIAEESF